MHMKKTRIRVGLFAAVSLWAVAASGVSVWLFLQHRGPGDPADQLYWRMQRARFDTGLLGEPPWHPLGFAVLADSSVAVRHWLLSIAENPREEFDLRDEAIASLVNMQDGSAWVAAMRDLLSYAEAVSSAPREAPLDSALVPAGIRTYVRPRAMEVAAPEDELLEIVKRADPRGWREFLGAEVERGRTDQVKARAKRLLEIAGGAAPEAQAGEQAQPKPAQPPAPAE